jgi:hypothetical protein
MLGASNLEVRLELVNLVGIATGEPATFLGGVGKGGEYALGGLSKTTLKDECVVDGGWF